MSDALDLALIYFSRSEKACSVRRQFGNETLWNISIDHQSKAINEGREPDEIIRTVDFPTLHQHKTCLARSSDLFKMCSYTKYQCWNCEQLYEKSFSIQKNTGVVWRVLSQYQYGSNSTKYLLVLAMAFPFEQNLISASNFSF